jgi:tripartite-type tricarboxylate transporter receptor subunit TctC
MLRSHLLGAIAMVGMCVSTGALAQSFPDHAVRIVVPFPPGGTLDGPARALAAAMGKLSGQPFVVENRAGAGGTVGASDVVRSKADGYTLLISSSSVPIAQAVYKNPPFDSIKSFRHVGMFVQFPSVIAVNAQRVQARTVPELIAYAKAHPGKLTYGSPGAGTASHFAAEMFKMVAGVDILHVPYRGAAPAMSDVLGGQIDMIVAGLSTVNGQLGQGKIVALGVTTRDRAPQIPDVPSVSETLPDYEFLSWLGVSAPAGTPDAVMARLSALMQQALSDPATQKQIYDTGAVAKFVPEAPFTQQIGRELTRFAEVVKQAHITQE